MILPEGWPWQASFFGVLKSANTERIVTKICDWQRVIAEFCDNRGNVIDFDYGRMIERLFSRNRWGTEGDFAVALGISPNTLTAWKRGRSSFGVHEIPKICDALGVDAHWLLFGEELRQGASLRDQVQAIVEDVHKSAKVHLSKAGLERTANIYFDALNNEIVTASDTEEVGMRLHLLRKRIEKDIANAVAEPGSGKQSA